MNNLTSKALMIESLSTIKINHLSRFITLGLGISALSLSLSSYAAISATTSKMIHGTVPYLTFDGGVTKVIDTNGLLALTLSDGESTTIITPLTNSSSVTNPIRLPDGIQTFAEVGMIVPVTATNNLIDLNELIAAPYNYWGDDDGDGQGVNGVTATGSLSVTITDKNGTSVNRTDTLSICNAPYEVVLTSSGGRLSTQYGLPNQSDFTASSETYYITPTSIAVCFAKPPDMTYSTGDYAGPESMWDGGTTGGDGVPSNGRGFILQSTTPATYGNNFPSTGANGLYFDLDIQGGAALSWPTVTQGGITATMTPNADGTIVRVTLSGPASSVEQNESDSPTPLVTPTLPAKFELEGKDGGITKVKYGFEIKQWYVHRGSKIKNSTSSGGGYGGHRQWCDLLGYRQVKLADVTNAGGSLTVNGVKYPIPSATPKSPGVHYHRRVGGGLLSEWGELYLYTDVGFDDDAYWTDDPSPIADSQYGFWLKKGAVFSINGNVAWRGLCTTPQ